MNNVIWSPLTGSQELGISYRGDDLLIEGSRGGGKTELQLMYFRQFVGQGFGEFWRGVIFDREYKYLDDIVARSKRWFYKFGDGAKFKESYASYKWVWPTGEELAFRTIKTEQDYWSYHGQELPFIGWNELTKYPSSKLYDVMLSCNRSSYQSKTNPIPLITISTCNPYGPGHTWVKKRFISPAKPGQVIKTDTEIYNPATDQQEIVARRQVRLHSSWRENRFLPKAYIASLYNIKDPNKKKAWFGGSWDIVAGGAIDDVWDKSVHVIKPFEIPETWHKDRSFDWGSSKPFSVLWFAESNGEQTDDGQYFPRGSVIVIREWYGCVDDESNVGLRMKSSTIAQGIKTIDQEIGNVWQGAADSAIFSVIDGTSIADKMKAEGIWWNPCIKGPGSRITGLDAVREYLETSVENRLEGKGLYIFDTCRHLIENIPVLPRDPKNPDDVDTSAEDHDYDALRYRLTTPIYRSPQNAGYR